MHLLRELKFGSKIPSLLEECLRTSSNRRTVASADLDDKDISDTPQTTLNRGRMMRLPLT